MEDAMNAEDNEYVENLLRQMKDMDEALEAQFLQSGSTDDLTGMIRIESAVLERLPQNHPDRPSWLNNLGCSLGRLFIRTSDIDDLNQAIDLIDMALTATPQEGGARAAVLINLANQLGRRFENTGSIDDINRAIELAEMAVDASPDHDTDRVSRMNNLGSWLARRFDRTSILSDLNRSIEITKTTLEMTPQEDPTRVGLLTNLSNRLGSRFESTGSIDDLNQAVEIANMAVGKTPQDHPNRYIILNNLGDKLGKRYKRIGNLDDLNRAIEVSSLALERISDRHTHRPTLLSNLGNKLCTRYDRTNSIEDLNRAIDVTSTAVEITAQNHPERPDWLTSLGICLASRSDRLGTMNDLDTAVEVMNEAVKTTPRDHPSRAGRLTNTGVWLGVRSDRTGSIDDLNQAIDFGATAVEITPEGHSDRASYLGSLGTLLSRRFRKVGSIDDINRAIEVAEEAVHITPVDHPLRVGRLSNLGILLAYRCDVSNSIGDLDRAIEVASLALQGIPEEHVDRATILNNLGNRLGMRFQRTKSVDDINKAIDKIGMAIEVTGNNNPYQAGWQSDLGVWLGERFETTGSVDDLNAAIEITEISVKNTPRDHPDRATRLSNLGELFKKRYRQTNAPADLDTARSFYEEGWDCIPARPSDRIKSAWDAAQVLAIQLHWDQASLLLQKAVNLLPNVSPRRLKHTDKQHMLVKFAGLASMAAATALNAGKDAFSALQLLELGRGIIASSLMEMRGDISDLKQHHPSLADELTSLRDELDLPLEMVPLLASTGETPLWELQVKRRREVDQKFGDLLLRIRAEAGFHNFLLAPTVDELMAAANPDPIVVVNLSSFRCDAFLIDSHSVRVMELPSLKLKDVQERARDLESYRLAPSFQRTSNLEWMWDTICRPCLEELGYNRPVSDKNWPRIWWIPTGLLSQLPIHAAGRHTPGSTETVIDRVMSSYASSVKALVYGRRNPVHQPSGDQSEDVVLIAMPETPGMLANGILPFAADEVDMLNRLCSSLHLKPNRPRPRRDDVLKSLQTCKIFHFAGHGRSDPVEPSQSCLLLEDWETKPLTVADLRDYKLQGNLPFLGYLSACSTGANLVHKLADEGIHLISALQLAGFRHAVGALWEVSDKYCVDVARVIYETIRDEGMTDIAVCRGLHNAVRSLRDGLVDRAVEVRNATLKGFGPQPERLENPYWIPYVHYGV
jgi:tetratricopeptide (TPR) repeat protein